MKELEGIWQPLYAELGGEEAPKMVLDKTEVELTDGKYTVRFGGVDSDHGSFEVAGHTLTLVGTAGPNAGRTIPCIFKLSGDTLSICYGLAGARPANFRTGSDPELYLVNYARKS